MASGCFEVMVMVWIERGALGSHPALCTVCTAHSSRQSPRPLPGSHPASPAARRQTGRGCACRKAQPSTASPRRPCRLQEGWTWTCPNVPAGRPWSAQAHLYTVASVRPATEVGRAKGRSTAASIHFLQGKLYLQAGQGAGAGAFFFRMENVLKTGHVPMAVCPPTANSYLPITTCPQEEERGSHGCCEALRGLPAMLPT